MADYLTVSMPTINEDPKEGSVKYVTINTVTTATATTVTINTVKCLVKSQFDFSFVTICAF